MEDFVIYHNPRCSKSRTTLQLLEKNGIRPRVVLYLESGPDVQEIRELLARLGISAAQLVRRSEADYKTQGLSKESTDDEIVAAMARAPRLIERPIVIHGERAVLGRPPENVMQLIDT